MIELGGGDLSFLSKSAGSSLMCIGLVAKLSFGCTTNSVNTAFGFDSADVMSSAFSCKFLCKCDKNVIKVTLDQYAINCLSLTL